MRVFTEQRGRFPVACYEVGITEEMRRRALAFAKDIVLSDNQYSRLLPESIRASQDVSMQQKIEIQRTYMGKLGELAFAQLLWEMGKPADTADMFQVYEGQSNVDRFDFITRNSQTVDVKTGFRTIHRRLLINVEQFDNHPKDYYVAVKLNAVDLDPQAKLVDWDIVTSAVIYGYADRWYIEKYANIHDFGEGPARWLMYQRLMGIDKLLSAF